MARYRKMGFKVVRKGARKCGGDFLAYKKFGLIYIIEVKINNAVLTPLQKKAKRKHGNLYIVERVKMPTATTCKVHKHG